ncbi:WD40-repeat-containing domain protein [Truncatella angustata]|uniref:Mitochondrial division protein 1 n=1 Tax=Truncatella angustata TaxID=152316 RepID=A0A9P8UXM3_9PEZI|nr:WD40-repeat-containing domain protein [Truncatella angustata]KAH6660045.1 WD40-repeat-containing domain protein [Truncatella angustata]
MQDAAAPQPPSKRRRVLDDSAEPTSRYDTPDEGTDKPSLQVSIRERPEESRSATHSPGRSRSRSRSPSRRRSRSRAYSDRSTSRSLSPSRSRSSSRSRSRSRSNSISKSRSRSTSHLDSPSASRSPTPVSLGPTPLETPHQGTATTPLPEERIRPNFKPRLALGGHTKPISQVRISPDGRWIASASADGTIKIWEVSTGKHMDTLVGHIAGVSTVAWSPDSKVLASGSDDKAIRLWDRVTGRPKRSRPLLGHHNYVYCLAFSPKGNILASGSYDEAVFLWDVRAGRLMRSLPAHSDPVSGIDFSLDGTLVVSCSTDGLTRVWDTLSGQCLRTMVHEDNPPVTSVCFAPNGRYILAFSMDSCLRLWDYVSAPGHVKKTYQGHLNKGFSIGGCFGSVDRDQNAFIAAASEDGDIVLWDVKTKEIVQRIEKVHDGVCFWVDVHGDTMVSCGQDGTIKVLRHEGPRVLPNGAADGIVAETEQTHDQVSMPVVEGEQDAADKTPAQDQVAIKEEQ